MGKRAASSSKVNRKRTRREKAEVKEEDDEIEEVSMQVVLAKKVPVKDEGRTKRTKAKKRSGPKVPQIRKPKLPQFAFEWFRKTTVDGEERPEKPLPQLVMEWKNLTEEERGHYITLAEEDRLRFEREYEEWRQKKAAQGKAEPALQDLLEKRRATLQRYLARAEGLEAPKKPRTSKRGSSGASRKRNFRPPEGFPKRPVKSAYGLFCAEQRAGIMAEVETLEAKEQPKEGEGADAEDVKADRPGVSKLLALRKAWSKLSDEEKADYVLRAAEDQERFRKELEVWRQDPANEMANCDFLEAKVTNPRSKKFPRPRIRRTELIARPTRPETGHTEIIYDILTGTQILAAQERKAEQKAARAARRAEELEGGAFSESVDRPDSRAVQDFETANAADVGDTSVDDLLGDLLAVEAEPADESNGDIFGNAFQANSANSGGGAFAFGSQQQVASGPQLCLDESGNIVLNQSSLSRKVVTETPLEEGMDSNIQEAVSQYSGAYKKTPRCVWTQSETDLFYEALSLYGSDLFLVQTFFRNKSAGQIKTKYNKEMKKNPKLVEEALTLKSKRLTKETFEKLHGKIDTSRHYKPPPEPQPGDEPEPEVPLPEEDDDLGDLGGMPPPEPEYCAEDESLTTNRLMALFD